MGDANYRVSMFDIFPRCDSECCGDEACCEEECMGSDNSVLDCADCEEPCGSDRGDVKMVDITDLAKWVLDVIRDSDREAMEPEKIIFNPPATIVYWGDGSKTVVKAAKGEKFDPYTGFCYAFTERYFGGISLIKKTCQRRSTGLPEASSAIVEGHKEDIPENKRELTPFESKSVAYLRRIVCDKFSEGWSMAEIAKRFKMDESDISEALGKEFE